MRLCLVFGLPLPGRGRAGEDDADEPVSRTARSDGPDLAENVTECGVDDAADHAGGRAAGPALDGGLRSPRWAAE